MPNDSEMEHALKALHKAQDIDGLEGRSHATDDGHVFRNDVGCCVDQLTYDFPSRIGRLQMPTRNVCNMFGCIALFRAIDKNVQQIETFADQKHVNIYRLVDGEWKSFRP